jgi:hypothetical protein
MPKRFYIEGQEDQEFDSLPDPEQVANRTVIDRQNGRKYRSSPLSATQFYTPVYQPSTTNWDLPGMPPPFAEIQAQSKRFTLGGSPLERGIAAGATGGLSTAVLPLEPGSLGDLGVETAGMIGGGIVGSKFLAPFARGYASRAMPSLAPVFEKGAVTAMRAGLSAYAERLAVMEGMELAAPVVASLAASPIAAAVLAGIVLATPWILGGVMNQYFSSWFKGAPPPTAASALEEVKANIPFILLGAAPGVFRSLRGKGLPPGATRTIEETLGRAATTPEATVERAATKVPLTEAKPAVPAAGVAAEEAERIPEATAPEPTPAELETAAPKVIPPKPKTKAQKRVQGAMEIANKQPLGTVPSQPKAETAKIKKAAQTVAQKTAARGEGPDTQGFWVAARAAAGQQTVDPGLFIEQTLRGVIEEVGTKPASAAYRRRVWTALKGLLDAWGIGDQEIKLRAILQLGKP